MYAPSVFPDFRNPTTVLRALILAKAIQLCVLFASAHDARGFFIAIADAAVLFEPTLLLSLVALIGSAPLLLQRSYGVACLITCAITAGSALIVASAAALMLDAPSAVALFRPASLTVLLTGVLLMYFNWRARATAPVMLEARLQSLQARIRPHFLFNSINTVASFIRHDPKLAEKVLLDLSDLFRAVLSEERMTVPLRDELEFARAYVDIEQLRLGERLKVEWHVDEALPMERPVPVLLLQPLIENAVYHGVEPAATQGQVWITLGCSEARITLSVENTVCDKGPVRPGNQSALANITERLNLLYDGQANVRIGREGDRFMVSIELPDVFATAALVR